MEKKGDFFKIHRVSHIDFKDVEVLKRFLTPHARIMARRKTGISAKNQRKLAKAVKRAREMGLLPYVSR